MLKATTIEMNWVGEGEEGVGPRTTLSFPFLSLFQRISILNGMNGSSGKLFKNRVDPFFIRIPSSREANRKLQNFLPL